MTSDLVYFAVAFGLGLVMRPIIELFGIWAAEDDVRFVALYLCARVAPVVCAMVTVVAMDRRRRSNRNVNDVITAPR